MNNLLFQTWYPSLWLPFRIDSLLAHLLELLLYCYFQLTCDCVLGWIVIVLLPESFSCCFLVVVADERASEEDEVLADGFCAAVEVVVFVLAGVDLIHDECLFFWVGGVVDVEDTVDFLFEILLEL